MNKRLKTTLILTIIVLIAIVAYALTDKTSSDNNHKVNNVKTESQLKTGGETTSEKLGRNIVIERWNLKFALPEDIDVTETKLMYKETDKYTTVAIASSVVADKVNKEMCMGGTLAMGSFAEITRYSEPGEERKQIGDYYYRVSDGPGYKTCYDESTYEKYYGEDVIAAIKLSLKEQ